MIKKITSKKQKEVEGIVNITNMPEEVVKNHIRDIEAKGYTWEKHEGPYGDYIHFESEK